MEIIPESTAASLARLLSHYCSPTSQFVRPVSQRVQSGRPTGAVIFRILMYD